MTPEAATYLEALERNRAILEHLSELARPALVSLLVAVAVAPIVYRLLLRLGSRQTVSAHLPEHAAKQGTPTMGGLIVIAGVAAGLAAAGVPSGVWVLLASFAAVGFADDYLIPKLRPGSRGLTWLPKLGLQILGAGLAAVVSGLEPLPLAGFVFVILFFANAFNFADGMDTLAAGIGVMVALGIGAVESLTFPLVDDATRAGPVMAAVAAAFVPFWFLNSPPARVFMGDVGSMPVGALLGWAVFTVAVPREGGAMEVAYATWLPLGLLSLVLVAEIVFVPMQIGWVKATGKRLFPFKTPVHHAFQAAGWPETRVVALFHTVQAGLCALAVAIALFALTRWLQIPKVV